MLDKQATTATSPTSAKRTRGKAVLRWLFAVNELAQAEQDAKRLSREQAEFLRRAKLVAELGDLLRAQGNELRSGSASPLTLDLFRQATYWALRAQSHDGAEPGAVWAADEALAPLRQSFGPGELVELTALLHSTFVEIPDMPAERQRASIKLLRRCASRLISEAERPQRQRAWVQTKRAVRLLTLIAVVGALIGVPWLRSRRDLAKDKPWSTSSTLFACHPDRSECNGVTTNILFHTKLENGPWFQYDFGKPLSFSAVTIRNRTDYAPEAAVPLMVEASDDGAHFRELARRSESFLTWRAKFATAHARYLRVRALKETFLHLEAVMVYP